MKRMTEKLAIDGGTPVRTKPLPWELPGAHWMGKEEERLVARVARAQSPFRFYGLDPQHMADKLEAEFRKRFGRRHALGVSSATAGLHIALAALGLGPGDEVLLPGYFWVSCVSAIVRLGAIPRLVDVDDTLCMDPEDLKRKITPHSKAVLLVHMSGAPGHVDKVAAIARKHKLPLVEDCAQSIGGSLHGRQTGTFGNIAVFSFQLNKNISSGEGGMIVCDDEHLFKRCFSLHDLGYARNAAGRLDLADARYRLWGVGARMGELPAAMALAQFSKLDRITGAMRRAKWAIRKKLSDIRGLEFRNILDPKGDTGPFLITLYPTPEIAEKFTNALRAEGIRGPEGSFACLRMTEWGLHWYFNNSSLVDKASIGASGWPWTDPANRFAKAYRYDRGTLPACDDLAGRGALLTIASCLTPKDIDDIVRAFRKVAAAYMPCAGSATSVRRPNGGCSDR